MWLALVTAGLVCLIGDLGSCACIVLNPSVRKSVALPEPNVTDRHSGYNASIGFGFDAMTNAYKVVRLVTTCLLWMNICGVPIVEP